MPSPLRTNPITGAEPNDDVITIVNNEIRRPEHERVHFPSLYQHDDGLVACLSLQATEEQPSSPRTTKRNSGRFLLESKSFLSFMEAFSPKSKSRVRSSTLEAVSLPPNETESNSNSNNNSVNAEAKEGATPMRDVRFGDIQSVCSDNFNSNSSFTLPPQQQQRLQQRLSQPQERGKILSSFDAQSENGDTIETELQHLTNNYLIDDAQTSGVAPLTTVHMVVAKEEALGASLASLPKTPTSLFVFDNDKGSRFSVTRYDDDEKKQCLGVQRDYMMSTELLQEKEVIKQNTTENNATAETNDKNECGYEPHPSKRQSGTPSYFRSSFRQRKVGFTPSTEFVRGDFNTIRN